MSRRGSRNACIRWGWVVVEDEDEGRLIHWSEGMRRWNGIIDCNTFNYNHVFFQFIKILTTGNCKNWRYVHATCYFNSSDMIRNG